jgi:parallel beta-helix repeat protein
MNSVRLDCAGHAILGDGSGAGLTLVGRTGVDVRNCVITGADEGIKLVGSSRNSFMLNEITNNRVGVSVESLDVLNFINLPSQGNEFRGNQVKNNDDEGFAVRDSHGNLFHANEVEANGRDGFDLNRSNNNAILANRVSLNGLNGIELDGSNNNVLNDNFSSQNGRLGNRSGLQPRQLQQECLYRQLCRREPAQWLPPYKSFR